MEPNVEASSQTLIPEVRSPPEELRRWQSETAFFDRMADRLFDRAQPIPREEMERYTRLSRPWFSKEYRLRLLGDLRGQRILDLGCGDGANAVLFARLGATVTGFDISPRSIELARHLASINGVADRTTFLCTPAESASLPDAAFDVLWADGVLHHLIPVLEPVLTRAARWVRPGGKAVFSEPVCLSDAMRRLRRHVPIHTDATPDERPLQRAELAVIARHLPDLELRWFNLLGRLTRFVLPENNYERASMPRKRIADAFGLLDRPLLALPWIREWASNVVLTGTFRA